MDVLTGIVESVASGLAGFFARSAWLVLRDLADILLVATLIYFVLAFLKGTRAMQVAIGMGFLLAGYFVSQRMGLITTWTLLDSVLTYLVLLVVVLFQNDIRRGLMRVGSRSVFRGQRTAKETAVIEEVIKAASSLAHKRIGALVVFERAAALDEFIDHGTVLDAEVTKELLYTIFIPSYENPMHDGAVIIREGRVWQAGAFMPLAGTASRDRTLGARHRAALGISEESDAVVVVVSEERGQVSICFDGNIVRSLDTNSLRDALFGLFYKTAPKKDAKKEPKTDPGRREPGARLGTDPGRTVVDAPSRVLPDGTPKVASDSMRAASAPTEGPRTGRAPAVAEATRPAAPAAPRDLPDTGVPEAPIAYTPPKSASEPIARPSVVPHAPRDLPDTGVPEAPTPSLPREERPT